MTVAEAARCWADAWRHGWEALDPEPILACYSPDALLSTEPFRDPYRGLDGIRDYVTGALGEEDDPQVWMSEPIVDGDRAAVSWWASLREGLVIEQWDAWNVLPERRPPPDWSPFGRRDT